MQQEATALAASSIAALLRRRPRQGACWTGGQQMANPLCNRSKHTHNQPDLPHLTDAFLPSRRR